MIVGLLARIGETMVVAIAAGGSGSRRSASNPSISARPRPAPWPRSRPGRIRSPGAGATFASLFFVGLLLFVLTFVLNLSANGSFAGVRQRY